MCSILECCVTFSGVKLSIRSFVYGWTKLIAVNNCGICMIRSENRFINACKSVTGDPKSTLV